MRAVRTLTPARYHSRLQAGLLFSLFSTVSRPALHLSVWIVSQLALPTLLYCVSIHCPTSAGRCDTKHHPPPQDWGHPMCQGMGKIESFHTSCRAKHYPCSNISVIVCWWREDGSRCRECGGMHRMNLWDGRATRLPTNIGTR